MNPHDALRNAHQLAEKHDDAESLRMAQDLHRSNAEAQLVPARGEPDPQPVRALTAITRPRS